MRQAVSQQLLPLESAVQRIERQLDSITLESNLQRIESSQRAETSNATGAQDSTNSLPEATCAAVLAKLEGHLALSEHRSSMQAILTKVEERVDSMREMHMVEPAVVEPFMKKLEMQLQAHQQSSSDALFSNIDMSQRMSNVMSQSMREVQSEFACLIGKYEQRLQAEMNRVLGAIETWSSVLNQGLDAGPTSLSQPGSPGNPDTSAGLMSSAPPPCLNIRSIAEGSVRVPDLTNGDRAATGGTLE
jgi:hypothetical protein